MSDPVRVALWGKLHADAQLTGLLSTTTAIFHSVAPQDARTPYVVLNKQSGTPIWSFGDPIENELWQVKAIDRGGSAGRAEDIAARIDVVLNDAALAITDQDHLYLRRDSDVDYSETDSGETYFHVGALYRLMTAPVREGV